MTDTTRYERTPAPTAIAVILIRVSECVVGGTLVRGGTGEALAAVVFCGVWPCSNRCSFFLYSSRYQSRS
ncbi:hypothetical protein DP42_2460 [Burkholderia pseudomallei]|nr:hypothetical protein DO73_3496 [Burkholderia pseudomallei]KGD12773.1 hypothetical protein DP42_2460 [Burkholderia pseudomallei]